MMKKLVLLFILGTLSMSFAQSQEFESTETDSMFFTQGDYLLQEFPNTETDSLLFAQEDIQSQPKEERVARNIFEVGVQGGAASFLYTSTENLQMKIKYNIGLGFYYTYQSRIGLGLRTGFAAEMGQGKQEIDYYTETVPCKIYNDATGIYDTYTMTYEVNNVSEQLTQVWFSIPIQVAYSSRLWSVALGPKIAIPFYSHLQNEVTQVKNTFFNPEGKKVDNPATEIPNLYPTYPTQNQIDKRRKYHPGVWCMLSANVDLNIPIKEKLAIGIGLYADYALNQLTPQFKENTLMYTYIELDEKKKPITKRDFSPIIESTNNAGENIVSKLGYFDVGIKLSIKGWE